MLPPDVRVVPIEVGLLGREEVEVPLSRRAVGVGRAGPRFAPEIGRPVVRHLRAARALARMEPEAGPLRRTRRRCEGSLEPGVLIGDMVRDDVDDGPDAQAPRLGDQLLGFLEVSEGGVDGPVVGDVVAAVRQRRDVPGREPDRVDAEVGQVRQVGSDTGEVADPVTVAVGEAPDVDLVDDRPAPPLVTPDGGRVARSGDRDGRSTRSAGHRCLAQVPVCHVVSAPVERPVSPDLMAARAKYTTRQKNARFGQL